RPGPRGAVPSGADPGGPGGAAGWPGCSQPRAPYATELHLRPGVLSRGPPAPGAVERRARARMPAVTAPRVAILRTRPETVVADYGRLMRLGGYDRVLARDGELLLKLNLSWTKYFPACSTQPWQLEGVVRTLLDD